MRERAPALASGHGAAHAPPTVVAILAALVLGGLAAAAAPVAVPPCTYGDVVLDVGPDDDLVTIVLDTTLRLRDDAVPADLVSVREAGFDSGAVVRRVVIDDLEALRIAAESEGFLLAVQSAYRSFDYQGRVHDGWVAALGEERARLVSARPGHSEHQLGTVVDLRSAAGPAPWDVDDWAATPEGGWVAANAHRFGFVVSYPAGAEARTCYAYEPWHLRWVGREAAEAVRASGLSLREWLFLRHPPRAAP